MEFILFAVKAKEVGKRLGSLVAAHKADTLGTRYRVVFFTGSARKVLSVGGGKIPTKK